MLARIVPVDSWSRLPDHTQLPTHGIDPEPIQRLAVEEHLPRSGRSMPISIRSSVDARTAGPTMATNSPGSIRSDTSEHRNSGFIGETDLRHLDLTAQLHGLRVESGGFRHGLQQWPDRPHRRKQTHHEQQRRQHRRQRPGRLASGGHEGRELTQAQLIAARKDPATTQNVTRMGKKVAIIESRCTPVRASRAALLLWRS